MFAMRSRDLFDRIRQDLDVVTGGVRASLPGTKHPGYELARVITPHPQGMEPEGFFHVGAAFSFSLWAITTVASTSKTTTSPKCVSATGLGGTPLGKCAHTWERTLALAAWSFRSLPALTSRKVRHTVSGDATDPHTSDWWRNTSISVIASPPSAIITAVSVSTPPRSCTGTNEALRIA